MSLQSTKMANIFTKCNIINYQQFHEFILCAKVKAKSITGSLMKVANTNLVNSKRGIPCNLEGIKTK